MASVIRNAAGIIVLSLAVVSGLQWGRQVAGGDGVREKLYVFKGYQINTNRVKKGFACLCTKIGGTPTWQGFGNDLCKEPGNADKVIKLYSTDAEPNPWFPNVKKSTDVDPPVSACCKSIPKVGAANLPGLTSSCW